MAVVTFVSLLAPNADAFYRAMVGYLARRADLPIAIVEQIAWQEREHLLERGQIGLGAVCGAQYVRMASRLPAPIRLLAVPVMQADRYGGRPIYFSDLIVRTNATFQSFPDLRGATLAYNELRSYSGYQVIQAHLAALGERHRYFGRVVQAGSHQAALRAVIAGSADVASIDSTVLERELQLHPELASKLRIIESLGPSPIPPLVAADQLPLATIQSLRDILLHMHEDAEGQRVLRAGLLSRFVAIDDSAYDVIRGQLTLASSIELAAPYSQY